MPIHLISSTLAPPSSPPPQEVSVVFKAEHARTFNEKLSIDISQRDFADAPGGIPYDVSGACA